MWEGSVSKKYAFLFPGQGAQAPGMVKDIAESFAAAKKVIDDISSITGLDMAKLLWESTPEDLARSDNSQIAITAAPFLSSGVLITIDTSLFVIASSTFGRPWLSLNIFVAGIDALTIISYVPPVAIISKPHS